MVMLRSAMMASVIALSCLGFSQAANAQWHGGHGGGFDRGFDHRGFGGNGFFFGSGFPGYGFGGYPYYPYYPAYYYPPYPYYPPYGAYPGYPGYPAAASPTVSPTATGAVDPATVREVQAELQRHGYNVGAVDGRLGPRTKTAIREYERQNRLPVDGQPSTSLRGHLQSHPTG